MLDSGLISDEGIRPLRRAEYERMVEIGLLADEKIELLEGLLVQMSPQSAKHAEAVERLVQLLLPRLIGSARVRSPSPLALTDDSEPEPDVAVIPLGDYVDGHPTRALLAVEVAESSLRKDRAKARLYAAAGIPEYWIVNLPERCVEVHRAPTDTGYADVRVRSADQVLRVGAFPEIELSVADLLP